jgi:hypothetical protein
MLLGMDARFLLITADGVSRLHPLPANGRIVVGRDPDCDLVLDHDLVSRQHLELRVSRTGAATIEDLGSRNGTTYRGRKLVAHRPDPIAPGETAQIGPFSLALLPAGASAPAVAPSLRVDDPNAPSEIVAGIARAMVSVLVHGEPGTGKEILARAIHRLSGRTGPFVVVPGATDDEARFDALIESARGGTAFLDEVGGTSAPLQAKLRRALESRELVRAGAVKAVPLDVRFVASTSRDLLHAEFRSDLFHALAGITLSIPPLRDRREKIAPLASQLLGEIAAREGKKRAPLSTAVQRLLGAHDWPGNVRELVGVMERAWRKSGGDPIAPEHLVLESGDPLTARADVERVTAALAGKMNEKPWASERMQAQPPPPPPSRKR